MELFTKWVYVSDIEASITFYTYFGFTFKKQTEDWIEFVENFAILKRDVSIKPEKMRVMFQVEDIETKFSLATKLGCAVGEIREESYGKLLTIQDPDGHWFEFYEENK